MSACLLCVNPLKACIYNFLNYQICKIYSLKSKCQTKYIDCLSFNLFGLNMATHFHCLIHSTYILLLSKHVELTIIVYIFIINDIISIKIDKIGHTATLESPQLLYSTCLKCSLITNLRVPLYER